MKQEIKAIIFDIGGVMASENNLKEHYIPLCKALNIDKKKFFEARDRYIRKAADGKISGREMIALFSKDLNIPYTKLLKNWVKYKRKSIKKNRKLERMIKKLKKQGYKVASLSNVIDIHHKLCNEKDIYSIFHINVLSYKVGLSKPDKRIYNLLLKKLNIPAKEAIFIDDYQSCLDGAKKLGMKTILFRNNKQLIKDLKEFGI